MKRINGVRTPQTEEELRQWEQDWINMMVTIWTENIIRLGIVDTGNLMRSLAGRVVQGSDRKELIHEFALYGIYVARGVGYGYAADNPGDLPFLGEDYRAEHGLDKKRKVGPAWGGRMAGGKPRSKKRNWFLKKYIRSMYVLAETERNVYGEMFLGNFSNVMDSLFTQKKAEGSLGTDISRTLARF